MSAKSLENYQPVDERIHLFYNDHPDGAIIPELVHAEDGVYRFRVEVFALKEDLCPVAVGYAEETTGKGGPVNRQGFALENCETSAIGRALANAGYSPRGFRPSREEMMRVPSPETDALHPGDVPHVASEPPSPVRVGDGSGRAHLQPGPDPDPNATLLQLDELLAQAAGDLHAWKYTAVQKHVKNLFLLMEQVGLWSPNALEKALNKHNVHMRSPHDELLPFAEQAFQAARDDLAVTHGKET